MRGSDLTSVQSVRPISDVHDSARVRRVCRQVMNVLDYDRIWSGPSGEISFERAVLRCIETIVRSGEQDESVLLERVLDLFATARTRRIMFPMLNRTGS